MVLGGGSHCGCRPSGSTTGVNTNTNTNTDKARDTIDVNQARTDNGATPLHLACYKGHIKVVEVLLDKARDKINVKQADTNGGYTPLMVARICAREDIVAMLQDHARDTTREALDRALGISLSMVVAPNVHTHNEDVDKDDFALALAMSLQQQTPTPSPALEAQAHNNGPVDDSVCAKLPTEPDANTGIMSVRGGSSGAVVTAKACVIPCGNSCLLLDMGG